MAVAGLVCIAGLSVAAWSVYDNTRPTERPKSASDVIRDQARTTPRTTEAAKGPEGAPKQASTSRGFRRAISSEDALRELPQFVENPTFTPVTNSSEATASIAAFATAAGEQSTKIDGLTQTPLQTSEQITGAMNRFLGPLAQGELTNGADFLTSNGGKVPESGKIPPMVAKIAQLLKFCELDVTHMRVHRAPKEMGPVADMLSKLPAGAVPMMINQQNTGDGRDIGTLTMPLTGLLQGSMEGVPADAPRVEVQVPAKFKDPALADQKFVLGMIFGQNTKTAKWVPINLQFHSDNADAIKSLSAQLRPAPPKAGNGAPTPQAPSDRR
ncbi:MAG: hypothetical protein JSS51_03270 [Planctomycetes bacterium]|nr:hypothetical protein [Planctomycetota bacterium]